MVDSVALYYPHIHIRDDDWLKYAVLYWPRMTRLRPFGYPTSDSSVARILRDRERWLVDLAPPAWAADEVGQLFLALLDSRSDELRHSFGIGRRRRWVVDSSSSSFAGHSGSQTGGHPRSGERVAPAFDSRLGYLNIDKVDTRVLAALLDAGLAITVTGLGMWVGMHPKLASIYSCALTERIAIANHLHPVTDQELPHTALSGWTVERLMQVLLDEPATDESRPRTDLSDAFVLLAFKTVVPDGLSRQPIEKILEVRARFGTELDAFRSYVTDQARQLAELQDIRDLPVFEEYLRTEVEHTVTTHLSELRERLRSIGLDSVTAVANVKTVALPPLAAALAETAGLPATVTGPAALAACVLGAPIQWRRDRRAAVRQSPVGYLFRIEESLDPPGLIDRLRRSWAAR
ncbi:DUF6236 family protein [Nocardia transvalensis]|uniref:DUF6236 family protein n=1 Tax=Nocardia transvalensis TaxID=37333 RepID=UPI0018957952|nr:DUF6236 family protein [Nocardia transvalensis]MBF6329593.1 hypothetical protein [Nocardia transvalensis]